MIYDFSKLSVNTIPEYDLIVIGSGPAGIVLVNELIQKNPQWRICVLESGVEKTWNYADRLKMVTWDAMRIKETSRERVFGGASTTWSGLSAPLDHIEMENRDYIDSSGWPITIDELTGYYKLASLRYRFPNFELFSNSQKDLSNSWNILRKSGDLKPDWEDIEEKIFLSSANPQRFGEENRKIFENNNIDLFLDMTAKELFLDEKSEITNIKAVLAISSKNEQATIQAKYFVICSGGIENPRLLLNSHKADCTSIGNEYDQVGRYLMNHPKCFECTLSLKTPVHYLPYYFGAMWKGFSGYGGLKLNNKVQKSKGLVNAYVRFEPLFRWSDNIGVDSFLYIVKRTKHVFNLWKKLNAKKVIELRSYSETGDETEIEDTKPSIFKLLMYILLNAKPVLQYSWYRLLKRPIINKIRICSFMEMEPNRENRVYLGDDIDSHHYPLPHVSYRITKRDQESIKTLHSVLAKEIHQKQIGTFNFGRFEEPDFFEILSKERSVDASHHIGTTRMGKSPSSSVVDVNQKVHTVKNLYINGSSVFPTSGIANPTYTIVALSIRLAEHLEKAMKSK